MTERTKLQVGDKGYVVAYYRGEERKQEAEVIRVARKYATLNIPSWSPSQVDMETGRVKNAWNGECFYTFDQYERKTKADAAQQLLSKHGIRFEYGVKAWTWDQMIALAEAVSEIRQERSALD